MLLNEYETIYVARPDLTDDVSVKMSTKFEALIADNAGVILVSEDWGKRKLAYIVNKQVRGHFRYLNYAGPAAIVAEIERNLRNEDQLLRFLTVKLADNVDVESARAIAVERCRIRQERQAQLRAEEESEARYRAEDAEDDEVPVEDVG